MEKSCLNMNIVLTTTSINPHIIEISYTVIDKSIPIIHQRCNKKGSKNLQFSLLLYIFYDWTLPGFSIVCGDSEKRTVSPVLPTIKLPVRSG